MVLGDEAEVEATSEAAEEEEPESDAEAGPATSAAGLILILRAPATSAWAGERSMCSSSRMRGTGR